MFRLALDLPRGWKGLRIRVFVAKHDDSAHPQRQAFFSAWHWQWPVGAREGQTKNGGRKAADVNSKVRPQGRVTKKESMTQVAMLRQQNSEEDAMLPAHGRSVAATELAAIVSRSPSYPPAQSS